MRTFEKNIIDIYGEQGHQWLISLPNLILDLTQKYQLSDLQPVDNMTYNYVAAGYQNKQPIILKLGLNHKALAHEANALKAFTGFGAVKVLSSEKGMLILERALPGHTLKTYFTDKEEESIRIVCQIITKLHHAPISKQHDFHHIKILLKTLDNNLDIPNPILSKARQLRDDLLATTDKEVLLHGDLHHDNILQHADDWRVIDPHGFIGDPAYEVCAFIRNPTPELLKASHPKAMIQYRIQLCAQLLDLSEQRINDWFYVQAVLAWAWQLEDNIDSSYIIKLVTILECMG